MIPDTKQPGDILRASDWNAAREQARRQVTGVVGPGLGFQEGPGGISIAPHPVGEQREHCKRMWYISGPTLPPWSLVHLVSNQNETEGLMRCELPDFSGRQQLGILQEGAAQYDLPWVQYDGIGWVLWDRTSLPSEYLPLVPGGMYRIRLGAKQSSHIAQHDYNGPLLALNTGVSVPAGGPTTTPGQDIYLALVSIGPRYADTVFCLHRSIDGFTDEVEGPFSVWVFGEGYIVAETAPGDIAVTSSAPPWATSTT